MNRRGDLLPVAERLYTAGLEAGNRVAREATYVKSESHLTAVACHAYNVVLRSLNIQPNDGTCAAFQRGLDQGIIQEMLRRAAERKAAV